MWLAEDDVITAEAIEKETMLTYYSLLNTKIIKSEKIVEETKRRNKKLGGK